jgi:hypothetical protein
MNALEVGRGMQRFLHPEGTLLVVDNIWPGNPEYWEMDELITYVESLGFQLQHWWQIRQARAWHIVPVRYGLIPRKCFDLLAERELDRLASQKTFSRWQYTNTLFHFTTG